MKYRKKKIEAMIAFVEENGLMDYGGTMLKDFCAEVDIDEETFYRWMKKADFAEAIEKAKAKYKDSLQRKLEISLAKSAQGYEIEDTQTKLIPDGDGNPTIREQVKTKKHVAPNVGAAIFILNNLDPVKWQNRQRQEIAVQKEGHGMTREEILKELERLDEIERLESTKADEATGG